MALDVTEVQISYQKQKLRSHIEELRSRLDLPAYTTAPTEQIQAIAHFLDRAIQLGTGSELLHQANLEIPLTILARVLCEDLLLCCWVAHSEEDAAAYSKAVQGEGLRLIRIFLEKKRGHVRHKKTGEDMTSKILKDLKSRNTDGFKVEQLAEALGLSKLYDIIYRHSSLYVHGKRFGLESGNKHYGLYANLAAISSFLKGICLIADNRVVNNRATAPVEIYQLLKI